MGSRPRDRQADYLFRNQTKIGFSLSNIAYQVLRLTFYIAITCCMELIFAYYKQIHFRFANELFTKSYHTTITTYFQNLCNSLKDPLYLLSLYVSNFKTFYFHQEDVQPWLYSQDLDNISAVFYITWQCGIVRVMGNSCAHL